MQRDYLEAAEGEQDQADDQLISTSTPDVSELPRDPRDNGINDAGTDTDEDATEDEEVVNTPMIPSYLPSPADIVNSLPHIAPGDPAPRPTCDAFNNHYVRIVHSNGIHHLALLICQCQGQDAVPLDLVACRFIPASFINIRTLFSFELLDAFRLSNLELKASAYQFYQLLRRVTMPSSPAQVVNLYHEFRRMSRVWRWMTKLKRAGYAHNKQGTNNVTSGTLANFCPTCPQPGINLPDNWEEDAERYGLASGISHD